MPSPGLNRHQDVDFDDIRYNSKNDSDTRSSNGVARDPDEKTYSIGDLATEFGVSLRTLRFYEARGLISPRREGVTRIYGDRDRRRIARILKGKRLNFTLTEIDKMLGHEEEDEPGLSLGAEDCRRQIEHLERQRGEIDAAIAELKETYRGLTGKA